MAIVDFREIPSAKGGEGDSDTWELFARDFFKALGLEIEVGPGRGADAGRDLVVVEAQSGPIMPRRVRWVVSCKHFAHSGKAVSDRDEPDPIGRVRKFNADGLIGFYSTVPSSTLADTFDRLRREHGMQFRLYDSAAIEDELFRGEGLRPLIGRYFPASLTRQLERAGASGEADFQVTRETVIAAMTEAVNMTAKIMVPYVEIMTSFLPYVPKSERMRLIDESRLDADWKAVLLRRAEELPDPTTVPPPRQSYLAGAYNALQRQARIAKAQADVRSIASAVSMYAAITGQLPADLPVLTRPTTTSDGAHSGPVLHEVPAAPPGWTPYIYRRSSDGTFTVESSGDGTTARVP